jgi:hypothetical protein
MYSLNASAKPAELIHPNGTSGRICVETYVSTNKKISRWPNNLILIFLMGFLIDFGPKIASERTTRKTLIILALSPVAR